MWVSVERGGCCRLARDLEKVHSEEGGDKTCEEGDGVGRVGGVESLEEDDGRYDGRCRKTDIIHRIHTKEKFSTKANMNPM